LELQIQEPIPLHNLISPLFLYNGEVYVYQGVDDFRLPIAVSVSQRERLLAPTPDALQHLRVHPLHVNVYTPGNEPVILRRRQGYWWPIEAADLVELSQVSPHLFDNTVNAVFAMAGEVDKLEEEMSRLEAELEATRYALEDVQRKLEEE